MITGSGFIKGGLPVIAKVNCGYDSFTGESWSEVISIHWRKRDGSKGKEIPDKVWNEAEKMDYGFCDLIEQVFDDYRGRNEEG